MKIKGMVVAVLVAGASLTVCAEAGAATPECSSARKAIQPVTLEDPGRWTYTYRLSWCADGDKISGVEVKVTSEVHDPTCTWVGRIEESVKPVADSEQGAWSAFDMSEFSCGRDKPVGVNPWVVITFEPSGKYAVERDVAPAT
jgi:hypothetical protein